MAWDDSQQLLYSGEKEGSIIVWNLRKNNPVAYLGRKSGEFNIAHAEEEADKHLGHEDLITDLVIIPKLHYLASSSLDKKVILWDTIKGEEKRNYLEHTMVSFMLNPLGRCLSIIPFGVHSTIQCRIRPRHLCLESIYRRDDIQDDRTHLTNR